jgi:hypothetical protein
VERVTFVNFKKQAPLPQETRQLQGTSPLEGLLTISAVQLGIISQIQAKVNALYVMLGIIVQILECLPRLTAL